jgi:hypothetical protein
MRRISIASIVILNVVPPLSLAEEQAQTVKETVALCAKAISSLENAYEVTLSLALAIILLGALVAVLQLFSRNWIKPSTAIVGIVSAALGSISASMYGMSHQTYERQIDEARKLHRKMTMELAQYETSTDSDSRAKIWSLIFADCDRCLNLKHDTSPGQSQKNTSSDFLIGIGSAFAQDNAPLWESSEPNWILSPPKMSDFLYFSGIAEGSDLYTSEKDSLANAKKHSRGLYTYGIGQQVGTADIKVQKFAGSLSDLGKIEDTYTVFDPHTNTFRTYTLLSVNKTLLEKAIQYQAVNYKIGNVSGTNLNLGKDQVIWKNYYNAWNTGMIQKLKVSPSTNLPQTKIRPEK